MERVSRIILLTSSSIVILMGLGCSTRSIMEEEVGQFDDINQEYDKVVSIQTISPTPTPKAAPTPKSAPAKTGTTKSQPTPTKVPQLIPHEPKLEGDEGFSGRRPIVDPFTEGEETIISVSYLGINAGDLKLTIKPFKLVNHRKSYHFYAHVASNSRFSMFYSVDNTAETFVDFETFRPLSLSIDNNESSRLVESKTFFDWDKAEASMWEKEVSKKRGEKKKKITWKIEPFSQNNISALFYLRAFKLYPGRKVSFRVADDGKNVVFKGEVLRREEISTDIGKKVALVIRPEFEVDGSMKPSGENLIWLSDDERKIILKIESKVKIGTLVGRIKSLK